MQFEALIIFSFLFILRYSWGLLKEDFEEHDDRYKLLRMVPEDRKRLEILADLYQSSQEFQLDFWKPPTGVGVFVDIMVPPGFFRSLRDFLAEYNIESTVIIEDVEKLILQREKPDNLFVRKNNSNPLLESFFRKRMKDESYVSRNRARFDFGDYHSYAEMIQWMQSIENFYPQMAKTFTIGFSHEGKPITGIQIGFPITNNNKKIVWIDGGMHAREWAATHTALYFIDQLISLYGVDSTITNYVNSLNFYILPVANPDGYEFSRSSPTPTIRFWRKNRGPQVCKKDRWFRDKCCGGVDLNRNFDFHWGETGSSNDLCSDIFQGTGPFSEPESRAIRDKVMSLYGKVEAFITLHTYSQMWIHPFSHERKTFPSDIQELQEISRRGVEAIESMYGTKFRYGTGADMLYPSSGGSDDWAKAKANVKYVYLLELRPGEEKWDGFLLDRRQLIPTARETWEGVKVVINAVMNRVRPPPIVMPTAHPTSITQQWTSRTSPFTNQFPQSTVARPSAPQIEARRRNQTRMRPFARINQLTEQALIERQRQYERLREHQRMQLEFWKRQQSQIHAMPQCVDKSQWCAAWIAASPNICKRSSLYMRQECARSCGFC